MNPVFPLIIPESNGEPQIPLEYIEHLISQGVKRICTTEGTSTFWKFSQDQLFDFHSQLVEYIETFHYGRIEQLIIGLKEDTKENICETLDDYYKQFGSNKNIKYMLLYPDRTYPDAIENYFEPILNKYGTEMDIWIHLKPIRSHKGLSWESYSWNDVFHLVAMGCQGFKEECLSFNETLKIFQSGVLNQLNKDDIVVAGGDVKKRFDLWMKRYECSFLTGLGSIYPKFDLEFEKQIQQNSATDVLRMLYIWEDAQILIKQIGWHRFFFTSLVVLGMIPFDFANGDSRFDENHVGLIKDFWSLFNKRWK